MLTFVVALHLEVRILQLLLMPTIPGIDAELIAEPLTASHRSFDNSEC